MAAVALQTIAAKRATGLRRPDTELAALRDLELATIAAAALAVAATQPRNMDAADWMAQVSFLHREVLMRTGPGDAVANALQELCRERLPRDDSSADGGTI